jgi:hypothetical protein
VKGNARVIILLYRNFTLFRVNQKQLHGQNLGGGLKKNAPPKFQKKKRKIGKKKIIRLKKKN